MSTGIPWILRVCDFLMRAASFWYCPPSICGSQYINTFEVFKYTVRSIQIHSSICYEIVTIWPIQRLTPNTCFRQYAARRALCGGGGAGIWSVVQVNKQGWLIAIYIYDCNRNSKPDSSEGCQQVKCNFEWGTVSCEFSDYSPKLAIRIQ
jgi:hypothetical protein